MTADEIRTVAELRALAERLGVEPERLLHLPVARQVRDELINSEAQTRKAPRTFAEALRPAADQVEQVDELTEDEILMRARDIVERRAAERAQDDPADDWTPDRPW